METATRREYVVDHHGRTLCRHTVEVRGCADGRHTLRALAALAAPNPGFRVVSAGEPALADGGTSGRLSVVYTEYAAPPPTERQQ